MARDTKTHDGIENVARMMDRIMLARSGFHLSACGGCGAPSFQQPCPLCGFYPMGEDKGTWSPRTAGYEAFAAAVERSGPGGQDGNIATWVLSSYGPSRLPVDFFAALRQAAFMDVPSARECWDTVVTLRTAMQRQQAEADVLHGWTAARELATRASALVGQGKLPLSAAEAARESVRAWIEDSYSRHEVVRREAHRALAAAIEAVRRHAPGDGNLAYAADAAARASQALAPDLWESLSGDTWYRPLPPDDVEQYLSGETGTLTISRDGDGYWLSDPSRAGQSEFETLSAAKQAGDKIFDGLDAETGSRLARAAGLDPEAWAFAPERMVAGFANLSDPSLRIEAETSAPGTRWVAVSSGSILGEGADPREAAELFSTLTPAP